MPTVNTATPRRLGENAALLPVTPTAITAPLVPSVHSARAGRTRESNHPLVTEGRREMMSHERPRNRLPAAAQDLSPPPLRAASQDLHGLRPLRVAERHLGPGLRRGRRPALCPRLELPEAVSVRRPAHGQSLG